MEELYPSFMNDGRVPLNRRVSWVRHQEFDTFGVKPWTTRGGQLGMLVDAKGRKIARKCGKELPGEYVRCLRCRTQPAAIHPAGKLAHSMPLADQSLMGKAGSDPPSLGRLAKDRHLLSMTDGVALKANF